MLVRLGVVACLFWLHFAYATTLKIINIVPFGSSSVKISFNQEIKKFKEVSLKNFKSYLELEAILTIPKKHYQFSKQSSITIAQFSPKLARVVISHAPKMTYEVKIFKDKLYVSIVEKKPLIRHQMVPKPPKHHVLKHQTPKPTPKSIKKEAKEAKEKTPTKPTKHARSKHAHSQLNERSAKKEIPKKEIPKKEIPKKEIPKKEIPKKEIPKKEIPKKEIPKKEIPKKEIPKKETENESKNQVFIAEKNDAFIKTKRKKHKKIVLDAGHGGKDCGAMSTNLVCEKDIVLEVVKFLHKELKKRGYSVLLTRDKDIYIDLVARTELANKKSADLFISVHANSIPKRSTSNAHGIETYFLSTARSERARKVAEQENKDNVNLMDYFSKSLLLNSLNTQRLIVSNKLAIDVQYGMLQSIRKNYPDVVDGGVREGPFWVLAGALMPSILIEIGYNSHAIESKRIQSKPYQKILAKGIADGIDSFFSKND
ncbi:N-acetylmuramoyl-L-alanine amidase [Helicobacter pylori UM299]|uniref:N-acetylmuramoyl-L-alanine amidase n=1 Tax=Helicobacter pylori TaxID=210 RepID=UPI000329FCA7|nr:N-acetylmuramoyl-L-alanine amidase [Helicobacter pylori]AGL67386.1 N-acetylmuramoyl-L-alanine amidase [Helicobacter pylori UM032]AGL67924.1 N-acetylmuramoyl-L-alanine amidase [Helicobacter pylori UM299]AGR62123.1 N-acetylmuramoyl-L-alanine amidase [Helicobacter pylori UM298]